MAIAGSVAPVFRDGGYDATATYDFYHALIHNNRLCFCRQDGTIGHEPQEESDEYWFLSIDGNIVDASTLNGKTESELSVADSAKLGGKGASEYALSKFHGVAGDWAAFMNSISQTIDGRQYRAQLEGDYIMLYTIDNGNVTDYVKLATAADLANKLDTSGGTVGNGLSTMPLELRGSAGVSHMRFIGSDDEIMGYLGFNGIDNPMYTPSSGSGAKTLLHSGNKPIGSYIGNGSAEQRTISTGGTGWAVVIWATTASSGICSTFVNQGGYGHRAGTAFSYAHSIVGFYNGDIVMSTNDINLNEAGTTYHYQVL